MSSYAIPLVENDQDSKLAIEMTMACWSSVHATLTFLMGASIDNELFSIVTNDLSRFTIVLGLLGLDSQRDAFLSTLCLSSVPLVAQSLGSDVVGRGASVLSERNVGCLKNLMVVARKVQVVLDGDTWYVVLETLWTADSFAGGGSPSGIGASIREFFEGSKDMDDVCFERFTTALCDLSKSKCAGKNGDEVDFAVGRLLDLCLGNVGRLVIVDGFGIWDMCVEALAGIVHSPTCSIAVRAQICGGLSELLNIAMSEGDISNTVVEVKILGPLKLLLLGEEPAGIDTLRDGLEILNRLLQASGQKLVEAWGLVFRILKSGAGREKAGVVRIAFPSLQLVCTDFLGLLGSDIIRECVDTLSLFGGQQEDVNISLASIGLLWTVSDYVLEKKGGAGIEEGKVLDDISMFLLAKLSELCSDERPEVRNTANQTLFRTIGMNGNKFTGEMWSECIWRVLFPLLERVKVSSSIERDEITASDLIIHHSRNTHAKQWDETKVLTLTGISKCIIDYFSLLVVLSDFDKAWGLFLDYVVGRFLDGSREVSMASVGCMKGMVGDGIGSGVGVERIGGLWRLAWERWVCMGRGVIDGADENKDGDGGKSGILHGGVSQEALTVYVSVFSDLFPFISTDFGITELKSLFAILSVLPLYHTKPVDGVRQLKMDFVKDTDGVSELQAGVLGIICYEGKGTRSQLDFVHIEGSVEERFGVLAGFVRMPFVRKEAVERGFTYVSLSRLSIGQLVALFEAEGWRKSLYTTRIFHDVLESLGIGMNRAKDVWRESARGFMGVMRIGLEYMGEIVGELEKGVVSEVNGSAARIISDFLMPEGRGVVSKEDEEFDIEILGRVDTDLLLLFSRGHVEDEVLQVLVRIIYEGSLMYVSRLEDGGGGGLGTDNVGLGREAFSMRCLGMLFSLCSDDKSNKDDGDEKEARIRLAKMVVPYLLKRTKDVLQGYVVDSAVFGGCPVTRVREDEVLFVLDGLEKLSMVERILTVPIKNEVQRGLIGGRCGLLFVLYPNLCDLVGIEGGDAKVREMARLCLGRIGFELGLDSGV
jgi:hypothetical protein